ncbi:hypothetical protein [Actinacidiphila sp. bgisy145]|uniref:hypothetical protein n=1 Tax=Actinacidiphila sp. bgisy145 TaxID=3413792 RepID=UPI003EBBC070
MTRGRWRALSAAAAIAVALSGCSSGGHKDKPAPMSARREAELRQQAQANLTKSSQVKMHWTGTMNKNMGIIEKKPHFKDTHAYVLEAACAGTGTVWLSWETASPISPGPNLWPEILCDGTVLRFPFTGNDLEMFLFVKETTDPPTGVLTWQIIPATH